MSVLKKYILLKSRYTIKGLEQDRFEIVQGQSSMLKFMSRVAPKFILKLISKRVDKMLIQTKS